MRTPVLHTISNSNQFCSNPLQRVNAPSHLPSTVPEPAFRLGSTSNWTFLLLRAVEQQAAAQALKFLPVTWETWMERQVLGISPPLSWLLSHVGSEPVDARFLSGSLPFK